MPATPSAPAGTPAGTFKQTMMSPTAPWWFPKWPQVLAGGLYAMTAWILYVLSPEKGEDPSDLFKTLAGAVVLTAFINGVVAAVFTSTRDSQLKSEVIASQAKVIAGQSPPA
jgi:hypothetical protein